MFSPNHEFDLQQTLLHTFEFESLRTGQQAVIEKVMLGQSCAAIFPTGSGKSLCYQLPAVVLPHLTLVVSPLLALMKDQLAFLNSKQIPAASIDSSQTREESLQIMNQVKQGHTKVLMISVERLKNERFRQFISQVPISLLVVDEAHCISEWGHNFRPDYLKLPHYLKELNIPQVLLLTATATQTVIEDMQSKFSIQPDDVVVTGFYRPNLDISVSPCLDENKPEVLLSLIKSNSKLPTIVYVTLQNTAEQVARLLANNDLNVSAYHAGMGSETREQIQNQFMQGQLDCIVATIAFGMGVDKSDIRRVIHFDLPKSIENYAQEIGRAGRDGHPSQCVLLANQNSISTLENFIFGDTPETSEIEFVLKQAIDASPQWEVVLSRLSTESNIRQLPLKTLLVYMEMEGVIESQYSYFADYRFKFLTDKQNIVNHFDPQRREFITALFNCSPQARTWCQVDFETLWREFQGDRSRAIAALNYFNEKGWIELESKLMTEVYRVSSKANTTAQLAEKLSSLFKNKETNDVNRIRELLDFFESSQCLSARLAKYFGDKHAPSNCNHCSVCRGEVAHLPKLVQRETDQEQVREWLAQLDTKARAPLSLNLRTKFLCGITTPVFTKIKARSLAGFGQLEAIPFSEVRQWVESLD